MTYKAGQAVKALRFLPGHGTCLVPATVELVEQDHVTIKYTDGETVRWSNGSARDFLLADKDMAS